MSTKKGYKGAFKLGTTSVSKITRWTGGGVTRKMLTADALSDAFDKWKYGKMMTAPITLEGWYDPDDSTGQETLRSALINKTDLSDPRLYFEDGANDYLELTDGSGTPGDAVCKVETIGDLTADKDDSGMVPISFTLRVSGGYFVKHSA